MTFAEKHSTMLATIGLAVVLFASTNIDDIFVLLGFFADRRYGERQIFAGQYLGIAALIGVSIFASMIAFVFPAPYVALLGLLPVLIGCKKLMDLLKTEAAGKTLVSSRSGAGNIAAVAALTIANGGDNIGIYTPVFATSSLGEVTVTIAVFALMVAVWILSARWLVNHQSLGMPIRRFGHRIAPVVLIAIGIYVMYEGGALTLFR